MQRGRDGAGSPSTDFESDEGGHGEGEEGEETAEKIGVDREDCGGEDRGEREHGEERGIAVGSGAIEADDGDKEKEMDRGEKGGIQSGVGAAVCQAAREKERVEGEKEDVPENETRRDRLAHFRGIATPPAEPFVQNGRRGEDGGNGIELACVGQGESGDKHEKKERGAVEALGRKGTGRNGEGGGHGRGRE